ncbi:MAG TPA: hypothetical protein VHV08_14880 [Pirellulales bacterium]|jgi:hypothetical protein|nr:hypothetical protein [Pirellulales bacterium]
MWFINLIWSLFHRIERLNFDQLALFTVIVVAVGFICLRGFGSRAKY